VVIDIAKLRAGYGLDANGYIVSDVSKDKIERVFMPCIQESIGYLKKVFHDQLHSVYLYGSVARGEAIVGKSDLDLIALFYSQLTSDKLGELEEIAEKLSQKYRSLVREVGIAVAYYDDTFSPANYYESAFLKEICVCLDGEDVGEQFGPYKLTPEIAISFNGDIEVSLHRALKRIETSATNDFKTYTQGFARKLIRTYYSMVMVRSQIWTTRIHEQAEVFVEHFPEKEGTVRTLIRWITDPPSVKEDVYKLFKSEGEWASSSFMKESKVLD